MRRHDVADRIGGRRRQQIVGVVIDPRRRAEGVHRAPTQKEMRLGYLEFLRGRIGVARRII